MCVPYLDPVSHDLGVACQPFIVFDPLIKVKPARVTMFVDVRLADWMKYIVPDVVRQNQFFLRIRRVEVVCWSCHEMRNGGCR